MEQELTQAERDALNDEMADEQYRRINDLLAELTSAVPVAESAVFRMTHALKRLMSPQVYDVEFAEGALGADGLRELENAAHALRNFDRILRVRKAVDE